MTATKTIDGIDRDRLLLAAARSPVASVMERGIDQGGGRGRPTLLAVSGGVDSTAMLVLAAALRERRREPVPGPLVIGHVDHALRASSDDDAAHVRGLGRHLGIEVVVRRLDWAGAGEVSAAMAREARWEALADIARSRGLEVLLLAHHGDDQAETVIQRLARGTGLAGLAAIPARRPLGDGLVVIRPLLRTNRAALESVVALGEVPTVEDEGNARTDRSRGLIRHEVLPRLEAVHPGAAARIATLAEEAAGVREKGSDVALPSPSLVTWKRVSLRGGDEIESATRLRRLVMSIPGIDVSRIEGVRRATWVRLARAILDDKVEPRRFDIEGRGAVSVTASRVTFESRDATNDTEDRKASMEDVR